MYNHDSERPVYRIIIEEIHVGSRLRAIRALRDAREKLHGDRSFRTITNEVDCVLDGDALVVGHTDDLTLANNIAAELRSADCLVSVQEVKSDDSADEEDEQWGAVPRAALVLMAAANGDPSLALGFAKSLGYNTDDPDLYDEVADLLRQAFPPEIPR